MNTFNAEDARKLSSDITTKENSTQLEEILSAIERMAKSEKNELVYYQPLREAVKIELTSRGFNFKYHLATSQRDDSSTTISW